MNFEDVEEEYKAIKAMPKRETGFENKYYNVTKEELKEIYEHRLITRNNFENAYDTANKIINTYNLHKDEYYKYIYDMYNKYKNKEVAKKL